MRTSSFLRLPIASVVLSLAACGGSGGDGGDGFTPVPPAPLTFVHRATEVFLNTTRLTHPLIDGNPAAQMVVTQVLNPGGGLATVANPHPIGIYYLSGSGRWVILNEDGAMMTRNAAFIVTVLDGSTPSYVHTATAGNTGAHRTILSRPEFDGQPNAILIVTQYVNGPSGSGAFVDNRAEIGVYYSTGTWRVFNEYEPPAAAELMPVGADFVIAMPPAGTSFVHETTVASIGGGMGEWTELSHPALDGNPSAMFQITQNWNPGAVDGDYNDNPVGAIYNLFTGRWAITNINRAAMLEGVAFNVWIQ